MRLRHADAAWLTLAVAAATYDVACKEGEMLSDGADRYRAAHPVLVYLAIGATAAHLGRILPAWADIYTWGHRLHRRTAR